MISAIFDDHFEAFPVWRENELRGLTCVHVDAHLDVMSDGFDARTLDGIAQAKTRRELSVYKGDPRFPLGGFHCGNYLYPALKDGTIAELIWVLPPHVIAGETFVDGVRQEVQKWVDLTFAEYSSLRMESGAVVGELEGCRFVVCTADNVPEVDRERLVVDIDVDYFIDNRTDTIWQTPRELYDSLGLPKPKALTIAYSVDGGYTPLQERFLGEIVKAVWESGDSTRWDTELEELRRVDALPEEQRREPLLEFLEKAPEWLKPAVWIRLGKPDEARKINSEYYLREENVVARHLIKKEFERGLEALNPIYDDSPESHYLMAYLSQGSGDAVEAKTALSKLLDNSELIELERARVLLLKANACLQLGEAKQAIKLAQDAVSLEPASSEGQMTLANAYRLAGEHKKAAKAIRKALRLSKGRVSSLAFMVDAAKTYDSLGQTALAKSVRKELRESDVTGRYAIKTMLDESKL